MNSSLRFLLLTLAIAPAYALTGWMGLLLAIPPGYATAIFPAAGVALALTLVLGRIALPGIWLGSFAVNWLVGGSDASLSGVLVPAGIASGSMLQAAFAQYLLIRFGPRPLVLDHERALVAFTVLAAMVGTLIGATVGIGTLYWAGVIPTLAVGIGWLTWWVGDSIGVLLITPLVLMLIGEPKAVWRPLLRRVAPLMLLTLSIVVAVFFASSRWENERLAGEFNDRASELADRLSDELDRSEMVVVSVERLFAASQQVDRREFRSFVERLQAAQPALNAVEWIPRVAADELAAHAATMRAAGVDDYLVWQRDAAGRRIPVGAVDPRSEYFPVAYAEPIEMHAAALGFDAGSEPLRRQAIERALASGAFTVSPQITLVQDRSHSASVLAMQAVDRQALAREAPPQLVLAVVNLPATVGHALVGLDASGIALRIDDLDAAPAQRRLFANALLSADDSRYLWSQVLQFGGRRWNLSFSASPDYVSARRSWQGWLVLLAGLGFTALLGALMLLASGRAARTERLVDERTRDLQRSERINHAVAEASPDGILLTDADAMVVSANRAAETLFAVAPGGLLRRPLQQLLADGAVGHWLRQQDPAAAAVLRCETTALACNALPIPVELTLTAVLAEQDHAFSCLLRDLRSRDELARMKNEFISVVSHELRTPLTSLRGAIGLLHGGGVGELPAAARQLLDLAAQNASRLTLLINDLLDFEKLELGGLTVELQPLAVAPLIELALAEMTGYANNADVRLRSEIEAELPAVALNADRFAQVLANLLSNAIKFSPAGGTVAVRALREADALRVEVRDHGPGIPVELHERVFSKFWQADSSAQRKHSGTGLGLAICKQLVERMHGEVGFDSQPGAGCTFWLRFPLAPASATPPGQADAERARV